MSNCLFEAAFENILHMCACAPGFHTMGGDEAMERYEVCSGEKLTCMNKLLNRMGNNKSGISYMLLLNLDPGEFDHVDQNGEQRKCRSACEDQASFVMKIMFLFLLCFTVRSTHCS